MMSNDLRLWILPAMFSGIFTSVHFVHTGDLVADYTGMSYTLSFVPLALLLFSMILLSRFDLKAWQGLPHRNLKIIVALIVAYSPAWIFGLYCWVTY